jgi:nucleotide-binding universal stress UspA family protein
MEYLDRQDQMLSKTAIRHFTDFCNANSLTVQDTPSTDDRVTAALLEETDQAETRLLMHARHSDLVVLGRPHTDDLMPDNLIELLLLGCGRPIVIAPVEAPKSVTGTIVVGWKESCGAARALNAALPLLTRANRVVLATVDEGDSPAPEALDHLVRQLAWDGIAAETRRTSNKSKPAEALVSITADLKADLQVVGAFERAPLRESVFGGVTRTLIEHAQCAVFMQH